MCPIYILVSFFSRTLRVSQTNSGAGWILKGADGWLHARQLKCLESEGPRSLPFHEPKSVLLSHADITIFSLPP